MSVWYVIPTSGHAGAWIAEANLPCRHKVTDRPSSLLGEVQETINGPEGGPQTASHITSLLKDEPDVTRNSCLIRDLEAALVHMGDDAAATCCDHKWLLTGPIQTDTEAWDRDSMSTHWQGGTSYFNSKYTAKYFSILLSYRYDFIPFREKIKLHFKRGWGV